MGRLRDVYWLGGGSGGAKSTVARALAERFGMRVYSTDDVIADHVRRCPVGDSPRLQAFLAMSMDERWVTRSPTEMLESFPWFRGEGFGLIVEDLLALTDRAPGEPVLVEGFRVLPGLVQPLLDEESRAVWLLPTPEFRRTAFTVRGDLWTIAARTGDPTRASANLLARDRLFTEDLRQQVVEAALRGVEVDGSRTAEQLVGVVAEAFGLTRRPGRGGAPRGRTPGACQDRDS